MKATTCARCGEVSDMVGEGGLCAACILRTALEGASPGDETEADGHLKLPRSFGGYELLGEIGRGGMGVVYRARQTALGRIVAVKLLLAGAYASEAALRRFQAEAAAAAELNHPGIVAIHDFGEHDGQPYLVMDLVEGRNLADACGGRPLEARRAAAVLCAIAEAVRHAHAHGILHRDLKPSNILLDAEDEPRITDFGIARRMGDRTGLTVTGQLLGSPSYLSPEQAVGDSASAGPEIDVYGLGAVLYHLVTGRAPFIAATPNETLRLVLESDPVQPTALNPVLPRELETICLKCLAKDPRRRYTTAAEVVEDVTRWLGNRPILARPPSVVYRIRKFTRRHRIGVAAVAGVILALSIGLVLALRGYREAVRHQRLADAARAQSQRLTAFILQDLQPDLRDHGRLESQKLTVEAAVRYFEQLPPELRNEATRRDQAAALEALAEVYGRKQGRVTVIAEGLEIARRAAQQALKLRREIAAAHPGDPEAELAVLSAEAELASNDPSAWTRLEQTVPERIGRLRDMERRFPEHLPVQRALAGALLEWTYHASFLLGRPEEGRAAANEARERWERLLAVAPDDDDTRAGYARSLAGMLQTLAGAEEYPAAIEWGEKAVAYTNALLRADPTNLRLLPLAAETAGQLAWTQQFLAPEKARAAERVAREHYRMLMTLDPAAAEWRVRYAQMHNIEANALAAEDRLAEARTMADEVVALLRPLARDRETKHMLAASVGSAAAFAQKAGDAGSAAAHVAALQDYARACAAALPDGSPERWSEALFWFVEEGDMLAMIPDWIALERRARTSLDAVEQAGRELPESGSALLLHRAVLGGLLGKALLNQARPADAMPVLAQAATDFRDAPAGGSVANRSMRSVETEAMLAVATQQSGDWEGGLKVIGDAWERAEAELAQAPGSLVLREAAGDAARVYSMRAVPTRRGADAGAAAAAHYRVLMAQQPANPRWRFLHATCHLAGCYFLLNDGQIERARKAFKEYDALLEPFVTDAALVATAEPLSQSIAIMATPPGTGILSTRGGNSHWLATLAAAAGDAADMETWVAKHRVRLEAKGQALSAPGTPAWRSAQMNFLEWEAWLYASVRDWAGVTRLAEALIREVDAAAGGAPDNAEWHFRRSLARGLIGLSLLREGRTTEAGVMLGDALSGIREVPAESLVFMSWGARRLVLAACVDCLAANGEVAQARRELEREMGEAAVAGGEDPGMSFYLRSRVAIDQVRLVELLDPIDPASVSRRAALLEHAAGILLGPEAEGRLDVEAIDARGRLVALSGPTR